MPSAIGVAEIEQAVGLICGFSGYCIAHDALHTNHQALIKYTDFSFSATGGLPDRYPCALAYSAQAHDRGDANTAIV